VHYSNSEAPPAADKARQAAQATEPADSSAGRQEQNEERNHRMTTGVWAIDGIFYATDTDGTVWCTSKDSPYSWSPLNVGCDRAIPTQPRDDAMDVLAFGIAAARSRSPREPAGRRLPTEAKARKTTPLATGCIDYFPDALAAVARLSYVGNEQHNPGMPLHWDRSKSTDEADALMRHFVDRGTLDTDGERHSTKVAWRALALLQKEIEAELPNQKI
jgi:Domain of unknown function (DUF5664)